MSEEHSQTEPTVTPTPALNTNRTGEGRAPSRMQPASQVGRYLLLQRLGEGGMGVVYSAYDPDLDRRVALKLLRPDGQTDSEEARARLLREAQALARVSHPNVIPIFDVGVWGEQVFLAMELVEGGTLASWLKETERPWREVLSYFLQAGRGLQAAHEAGLVHRDFKPANVLVSRTGRVFVTDFGLARQMGGASAPKALPPTEELARRMTPTDNRLLETPITQVGLVMGTPSYMSPEQFRDAELDARSDQFSFCAALYLGLYRQRPFEPGRMESYAVSSAAKSAKSAPPPDGRHTVPMTPKKPRAAESASRPASPILEPPREARVPTWVKQAVMRGLALEPAARFPSMTELLEALSQEQRRVQRRRWGVGAAVVGAALTVVGVVEYRQSRVCVDAGAPMDEVWSPTARQKMETAFGATGRSFAREMATRVSGVLDGYAAEWKRQNTAVCETTRRQGTQPQELLARRVVCLERRRKDMRATVELLAQADASVVTKALDAAYALPALQECEDVETLAEQQGLPTNPTLRAEVQRLEEKLTAVRALVDAGSFKFAREAARQLEAPVLATGYLPLIAETRFHLGWLEMQLGEPPEAAQLLSQAVYDAEASRADRLKISILNKLLYVEDEQRHFPQAEGWAGLANASLRRIGGAPVLESDVKVNQANLAVNQGRLPEAKALLEQARALQERVLPPGHPKRARTTFLLGRVLLDLGEKASALAMLEEALKQTEASVGPMHPDMAQRHGMIGVALREMKEPARALPHVQAGAVIRKAHFGATSWQYADSLDELGWVLLDLRRYDEALAVYQEALTVKRQSQPEGSPALQYSYDGVGQALLGLGRAGEAVEVLRKAVAFTEVPPDVLAESGFALARALALSGSPEQARDEAIRARERFTQASLPQRVADVDAFLVALPKAPAAQARTVSQSLHP
ncbi:serine/threonine-protein kinase [Hyalangium gracile]|uniref:serine/threonine-protein kinase n=1 Tax=Hyalangium gracile TaxID=394092 RepID=UPI001CCA62B3|nr:serine/threonine-protein kinase [Hyalangium gracile]